MNAYLDCIKLEMDSAVPKDTSKLSADNPDQYHGIYLSGGKIVASLPEDKLVDALMDQVAEIAREKALTSQ